MITRESLGLAAPYEAPSGELEKLIAAAFAEVSSSTRSAPTTSSSIWGGSLRGEVLSGLISERAKRDFQILDLIENGMPRQIAKLLGRKSSQQAAETGRPPIFLVHGRLGYAQKQPRSCCPIHDVDGLMA